MANTKDDIHSETTQCTHRKYMNIKIALRHFHWKSLKWYANWRTFIFYLINPDAYFCTLTIRLSPCGCFTHSNFIMHDSDWLILLLTIAAFPKMWLNKLRDVFDLLCPLTNFNIMTIRHIWTRSVVYRMGYPTQYLIPLKAKHQNQSKCARYCFPPYLVSQVDKRLSKAFRPKSTARHHLQSITAVSCPPT